MSIKKKRTIIIIIIIYLIGILMGLDMLNVCKKNKPLFILKTETNENCSNITIYRGLLYDTYVNSNTSSSKVYFKFKNIACDNYDVLVENKTLDSLLPQIGIFKMTGHKYDETYLFDGLNDELNKINSPLKNISVSKAYTIITEAALSYVLGDMSISTDNNHKCPLNNETSALGSCYAIKKVDLEKIIRLYDIPYSLEDIMTLGPTNKIESDKEFYYIPPRSYPTTEIRQNVDAWYGKKDDENNNILDNNYVTIKNEIKFINELYLKKINKDSYIKTIYYEFELIDSKYKLVNVLCNN